MNKLCLVEDNPDNADLIIDLLSDLYQITHFNNGQDALDYLNKPENDNPEIMLIDISMPGMDGMTLLKKIRDGNILEGVPAIALTAHAMKHDRERFLSAGFDGYISKPIVDDSQLINEIKRLTS